jgi:ribosomal protein S18 acetylase RimI-like enzyme
MLDVQESLTRASPVHLRLLNPGRDLLQVADLIEICFASTMDPDGRDYLRQMRLAARDESFLRWSPSVTDGAPMGMSGFVWEENGTIAGNLSLIPMIKHARRIYLIANVATHPTQRQRGIGRALTQAAVDFAAQHGAASAWLQVRQDNFPAFHLYESIGFIERARRTTWVNEVRNHAQTADLSTHNAPRNSAEWPVQRQWLTELYPRDVIWNLPIHPNRFSPGLLNGFARFLFNEPIEHWAAHQGKTLLGLVTWEPSRTYADNLWMAASDDTEELAIRSLLPSIRRLIPSRRPFSLNYPAGRSVSALNESGFIESQTLIWMEKPFT